MKFCCVDVIAIILEKQFCSNVIVFNFICFGPGRKYREIIKVREKGFLLFKSGENHENSMEIMEFFFSEAARTLLFFNWRVCYEIHYVGWKKDTLKVSQKLLGSNWTKILLSIYGTLSEHWFFKIWLFKNSQIFQNRWKTDYVGRKIEKMKFLLRKEKYLKYLVLGDEINNKWSSNISSTVKYKLQIL